MREIILTICEGERHAESSWMWDPRDGLPLRSFGPFHDLPKASFDIFVRGGDGHADEAFAVLTEGRAGNESHPGFVEQALADLERGHFERTEVEKEIEGALRGSHQDFLTLKLMS